MRISDWSSDVCSSDLLGERPKSDRLAPKVLAHIAEGRSYRWIARDLGLSKNTVAGIVARARGNVRSEEHTSELQSLMRISYAVFCLKKKKKKMNKSTKDKSNTMK